MTQKKDVECLCVRAYVAVLGADAGLHKSVTTVKFNVSSISDQCKGRAFAPRPHNEVSITATTKEMFF